MANIWRKNDNVKEQPKRNIMDLSFQNNLTTQFGKLVPVFCKEFIPGDSFSIKPTFSLKFQPMVFPIQTRMRAHLHFFKVRNRNLWKDWEDFIAKNKENLDPPYLDTAVTKPTTGSLLDYLGVPTTLTGTYGDTEVLSSYSDSDLYYNGVMKVFPTLSVNLDDNMLATYTVQSYQSWIDDLSSIPDGYYTPTQVSSIVDKSPFGYVFGFQYSKLKSDPKFSSVGSVRIRTLLSNAASTYDGFYLTPFANEGYSKPTPLSENYRLNFSRLVITNEGGAVKHILPVDLYGQNYLGFSLSALEGLDIDDSDVLSVIVPVFLHASNSSTSSFGGSYTDNSELYSNGFLFVGTSDGVKDIDEETSPYWRSGATLDVRERIKLSALPCRAYEQIYNSFYRNAENNPYILNGVPEYNKYMPTDEGGVDANLYDFYYRNWEDDFLTTALQQPQAGIAPLVGLTGTAGTATVTLADEDGNTSEATASYDEEGNVTSVAFANNTSLTEALADAVQYGISINDLRNVNAFQRWLEAKARGGYKYRDVIETMFGITVRYDTLDMPEFIGGTSIDIMVNQISQTVPTETSPLGDYAGQAAGIGTGQTINEYFDEHGFIIGILSVVPVPNYSQLLPKHFIKRDAFDYYFPQFGHIGMQPIKYDEVCPVQAYQDSTEQNNVLDETFGYQRAWYDYLASTDEVHGEFRTNLRNFVMNRTFDVKPELVNDFLTVDPSQLNDVFAIQDDSYDKILGQIYFDVKAKRPIPLYGIPKLE